MDYSKPKSAFTRSYLIDFSSTGKGVIKITDVPFPVSAIKVYHPNYTRFLGTTDTEWLIYTDLIDERDVFTSYSPCFATSSNIDFNPRFHYFASPKPVDDRVFNVYQASSSNPKPFQYDGTIPTGTNFDSTTNKISITMTFYEH